MKVKRDSKLLTRANTGGWSSARLNNVRFVRKWNLIQRSTYDLWEDLSPTIGIGIRLGDGWVLLLVRHSRIKWPQQQHLVVWRQNVEKLQGLHVSVLPLSISAIWPSLCSTYLGKMRSTWTIYDIAPIGLHICLVKLVWFLDWKSLLIFWLKSKVKLLISMLFWIKHTPFSFILHCWWPTKTSVLVVKFKNSVGRQSLMLYVAYYDASFFKETLF